MKTKRTRLQMKVDVLTHLHNNGSFAKTAIMLTCNFSWVVICEIISNLESIGLISENSESKWGITSKGIDLLNSLKDSSQSIDLDGKLAFLGLLPITTEQPILNN
jgi:predicted transcriptional regulator